MFASPAKTASPSLEDYTNFHGMLCSPVTAQRCINSFNGGSVLFMPRTYTSISKYDCVPIFNIVSYYMLVFFTLTGLSTLFKITKTCYAKEHMSQPAFTGALRALSNKELVATEDVLTFIKEQQGSSIELKLERQFEYEFFGGLSVVMFHLVCNNNKLHLVEVYQIRNKLLSGAVSIFSDFMSMVAYLIKLANSSQIKKEE